MRARGLRRLEVGPIDLDLAAGDCLAVTGPSGAGKSVLLRMLADLDPHEGQAWLDGQACSAMPAPVWRRQVCYVAADSGWWLPQVGPHFTAGTDLATLLPRAGIAAEAAGWPVARLSTGERQRLALLRALRPGVRVLLLDEPTSGLDADNVARIEALLRQQLAQGLALLMVTHDAAQAARLATHHLALRGGRPVPAP
ncbi:MAG: ATP-binding cassette domain-containing protein [Burkholderiales bacterium]|nr:ATP-binding cassette domain-containing protein [Burkholderiales bacterium]MDE2276622.1 ATP-binding cassette domain-containing protein [Burkholderiales bacterium]